MLTGYWPGKLMLDPETIALSLPILTGEPPEGVSYLSRGIFTWTIRSFLEGSSRTFLKSVSTVFQEP